MPNPGALLNGAGATTVRTLSLTNLGGGAVQLMIKTEWLKRSLKELRKHGRANAAALRIRRVCY